MITNRLIASLPDKVNLLGNMSRALLPGGNEGLDCSTYFKFDWTPAFLLLLWNRFHWNLLQLYSSFECKKWYQRLLAGHTNHQLIWISCNNGLGRSKIICFSHFHRNRWWIWNRWLEWKVWVFLKPHDLQRRTLGLQSTAIWRKQHPGSLCCHPLTEDKGRKQAVGL